MLRWLRAGAVVLAVGGGLALTTSTVPANAAGRDLPAPTATGPVSGVGTASAPDLTTLVGAAEWEVARHR